MHRRTARRLALVPIVALALSACSGSESGGDQDLKLASFSGPNTVITKVTDQWIEDVEEATDGSVTVEQVLSEGLLPAAESLQGVADRRAEMGLVVPLYHPGELPLSQIVSLPFRTSNMPAQMATFADLSENNEALRAEWESQGVHQLYWGVSVPMVMGCSEPIETIDDFDGRTVRAASPMAEVLEEVGANVVAIPSPEVRDAMERGVIDCWTSLPIDFLTDAGLHEVTNHIYDAGAGNYIAAIITVNQDVWDGLSEDQQDAMTSASETVQDRWTEETAEVGADACDKVLEAGKTIKTLPPDVLSELTDIGLEVGPEVFLKSAGEEGPAFLEEYDETLTSYEEEFSDYKSTLVECSERG